MQVLLPIDGSHASARAARFFCVCAHGRQGQITPVLFNVQHPEIQLRVGARHAVTGSDRAAQDEGMVQLSGALQLVCAAGFSARTLVVLGDTAKSILAAARENAVAAVVMGTRGKGMVGGFGLGSVALRVAPASSCPVILVKPDARLPDEARPVTRVILPVDGSQASDLAVAQLVGLKDLLGPLDVELVHFETPMTLIESITPPHDDVLRRWGGEQSRHAVAAADRLLTDARTPHQVSLLVGDPAASIAELATCRNADLIVIATHGTSALHHAIVGSVALKTVSLAKVPVMLAHSDLR